MPARAAHPPSRSLRSRRLLEASLGPTGAVPAGGGPVVASEAVYDVTLPLNGEWAGPPVAVGEDGASVHATIEPSLPTTNAQFWIEGSVDGATGWRPLTGPFGSTSATPAAAPFGVVKIPAYTPFVRVKVFTNPLGATTQFQGKVGLRVLGTSV